MQHRDTARRDLDQTEQGPDERTDRKERERARHASGSRTWRPADRRLLECLTATLLASLASRAALAQTPIWLETVKAIHPYAAITGTTDSNPLRRPSGLGDHADQSVKIEAGLSTKLDISRQQLLIDARVYHVDYDRLNAFDYTAGDAHLRWKWSLGRAWEGELGYHYDRKLRDMSNQLVPIKDMIDRYRFQGSVDRWLTTRWRLGGQIDWTRVSSSTSQSLEKGILGYEATLDYVSKAGNRLGLKAATATTAFDNRSRADFKDFSIGPSLEWQLTGKTRLTLDAGYETRRHEHLKDQDFEGFVGRLAATWNITAKTSLKGSVWRDISNLDDEIANYAVIDGVSLQPTWKVSSKTSVRVLASYERRDFRGAQTDALDQAFADRVDRVKTLELGLDWEPRRNLKVGLGFRAESRDSNRAQRSFDTRSLQLGISVGF